MFLQKTCNGREISRERTQQSLSLDDPILHFIVPHPSVIFQAHVAFPFPSSEAEAEARLRLLKWKASKRKLKQACKRRRSLDSNSLLPSAFTDEF